MGQVSGIRREVEEALTRRDWQSVQTYARNGIRPDELRAFATVYNSKTGGFPSEHFWNILVYCSRDQIEAVFKESVNLCLWRSVGEFLKQGVKEDLRKWAVSQALRGADTEDLADILPYCTDDQFDESFSVAVNRGIWRGVNVLLRQKARMWLWTKLDWIEIFLASPAQRHRALTEAISRADDDDLSTLLLTCADHRDVRDECLIGAVIRGLWVNVKHILKSFIRPQEQDRNFWDVLINLLVPVPHSDDLCQWALTQAAKRADEKVLQDYLPLFHAHHIVRPILRELVKRSFWRAASELLLLDVDRDSAGANTTSQTPQEVANTNQTPQEGANTNQTPQEGANTNQTPQGNENTNQTPQGDANTNQTPKGDQNTNQTPQGDSNTNQTPQEHASVNPQHIFRFEGNDDRVEFILKEAVGRGMWGVVKMILKQSSLADEQVLWVTGKATEIAGVGPVSRSGTTGPHVPKTDQLQSLLSLLELNTDAFNSRKMTG